MSDTSDSLRDRCIEAGARALAGRSEDAWGRSTEQSKTQYRFRAEAVLDAVLGCLAENAVEWEDLAVHPGDDPFGLLADSPAVAHNYIAALREGDE